MNAPQDQLRSEIDHVARARDCRCERALLDNETCLRCGRPVAAASAFEAGRALPRERVDWTRLGVVRALTAFKFFRGRAPLALDWNQRMGDDWPDLETIENLFGSLGGALRAAGLAPADRSADPRS